MNVDDIRTITVGSGTPRGFRGRWETLEPSRKIFVALGPFTH